MLRRFVFSAALGVSALLSSSLAGAQATTPSPVPPLAEAPRPSPQVITRGTAAGLFAISYVPSVVVAMTSDRSEDNRLYIPVAGPWLDLGERDCAAKPCTNRTLVDGLLIADGIAQGLAVIGLVGSFLQPAKKEPFRIGTEKLQIAPAKVGRDAYGFAAIGRF